MSDISKIIGSRIRMIRNDKGFSIEGLAEKADINTTHLGRIERGESVPKLDSIEKLVNALGITFEELFRYIPPAAETPTADDTALTLLINRLNSLDPAEQREVLNLFEILFKLIKK